MAMTELTGRIHSLESFGTVDGPGIRYVVFFQGCPMRCLYCHNPDTWEMAGGTEMTADEIIEKITRNREFYTSGGITATGGEPMLQIDFLTELFTKAKQNGIHTALDTCGILFDPSHTEKVDRLMAVTDLVLLDIKHMFDEEHKKLTGHSNARVFAFAEYLKRIGKPVWIRHVVVPGITFQREELLALGRYLKTLTNLENYGLFHATCEGSCSWADFAEEIFRLAGKTTKVTRVTTEEYGSTTKRPAYSVLDNYMLRLTTGARMADWKDALRAYLG